MPRASCEIVDPFLTDERPLAAAVEAARRTSADVIGLGLRVLEDCIPIDGLDERAEPLDVHSVIGEVRELVAALREARPDATIVLGGAGFSACPSEALDALDVPLGVVGAGRAPVPRAGRARRSGRAIGGIPGWSVEVSRSRRVVRRRRSESAAPREPLYSPAYGFPVRLRTGCAMQCSYCTAANMGRVHGDGDVGEIVDEIAALVAAARSRGLPVLPLFLAADEVNLPDARLLEELLRRIVDARSREGAALARLLQPDAVRRRAVPADRRDARLGLDDGRLGLRRGARAQRQAVPPPAPRRRRRAGRRHTASSSSSD